MRSVSLRPARRESGYRLRVDGQLDSRWLGLLEPATTLLPGAGETTLLVPGADQSALLGLLRRIHNLGLRLLAVERQPQATPFGIESSEEN